MDERGDFSLCGKAAVTEANLRDEYYWKLVADFIGPQSGEGLGLDEAPCKSRLLIQVGLLREDNNFPWIAIIDWLKRIFPRFQSADFRCLIERGIATTLSLGSEARLIFLESAVNFNFVGPICDSIGVERAHLLEMRDFSERAQSIEVTNGLILELSNFVAREKLAPVVIVSWLRNFNPEFCKTGDIKKAYRVIKAKIKKLKLYCRNYETRRHRRTPAMEAMLQSPFELVAKRAPKFVMKKRMRRDDSSYYEKVKIKDEYESYEIMQGEGPEMNKGIIKKTILRECVSLRDESGDNMDSMESSSGEEVSDKAEPLTLLDIAMLSFQKLSGVHGGKNAAYKQISFDLLKEQYILTCKEHPAMVEFEKKIYSLSEKISLAPPVVFLNYNANFLVGVHNAIEQHIVSFENDIIESRGEKLGRDKLPKFKKFVNLSESATSRYIHMAWGILSAQNPNMQNYKKHWVAFCEEKRNPSTLKVIQSNPLNNYFEAAAGLIHHHGEIALFISDLQSLNNDECPNVILESIAADANDSVIQSLVCVMAIIYCKVLGPYLRLLKGEGEYSFFGRHLLCLYQKFLDWSKHPSTLLEPEEDTNVFEQFPLEEKTFNGVFHYCGQWHTNRDLIRACLKQTIKVIATVTDEHLKDFLPGGKFSQVPSPDVSSQLASCTFSVLMAEYPFENSYSDEKKTPEKSSSHTNLSSDSSEEDGDDSGSFEDGSDQSSGFPAKRYGRNDDHSPKQKKVCKERAVRVEKEEVQENMDRDYIIATVRTNGGPCKTQQDVDKMMLRFDGKSRAEKREAVRCEILYHKMILNNKDPHLDCIFRNSTQMVMKLKLALPRIKPGYSLVLAPKKTKTKTGPTKPAAIANSESSSTQEL
uniref:Uncharacterized LOC115051483 n=2 Tax=Echeneis naucrates TaxID=173247 RepID=A0A665TF53_ECHNA